MLENAAHNFTSVKARETFAHADDENDDDDADADDVDDDDIHYR